MIFYLQINIFLKNNFKIIIKHFNILLNYKSFAEKKTKDIKSKLTLGLINILKELKNLSITSYAQLNLFLKNNVKTVLTFLLLLLLVLILPIKYLPLLMLLLSLINIINFYIFVLHYILNNHFKRKKTIIWINVIEITNKKT